MTMADEEILSNSVTNPNLFSGLVVKYRKPFMRTATKILMSRDAAEDAVQETFVKIYIKASKFKKIEGASFSSWAYRILLNTCYTEYRKYVRERSYDAGVDSETLGWEDKQFSALFDLDSFLSLVSRLPIVFQRVLKLSVLEGRGVEEVAKAENISVGAARTKLHRAKKAFKKARLEII